MLKQKFVTITILLMFFFLGLIIPQGNINADPVWEVHIDVYTIVVCDTHNVPKLSSFQWYCAYSETRTAHFDGHENATESYEDELDIIWDFCGSFFSDYCHFTPEYA